MNSSADQTLPLDLALRQAVDHHQAGRLQEAEKLYRAILQAQPNQSDAHHNLGVLAVQVHQADASLPHFKAALDANSDQTQYWLSYIDALIRTDQMDAAVSLLAQARQRGVSGEAIEALAGRIVISKKKPMPSRKLNKAAGKSALHQGNAPTQREMDHLVGLWTEGRYEETVSFARTLNARFPKHGPSWKMSGIALNRLGRHNEALKAAQHAVKFLPADANAHYNLGVTFQYLDKLEQAEACYRSALRINPDDADVNNNLGNILKEQLRLAEAAASFRRVLQIKPEFAEAHGNLGNTLKDLGQPDAAVASYLRALEIKPDYHEAHNNLGNTLKDLHQLDRATACYRRALQIKPGFASAHSNLGNVLRHMGELDEALICFMRALQIEPDFAEAHGNLGNAMKDLGRLDDAVASYRRALQCKPDFIDGYNNLLFAYSLMQDRSQLLLLAEARSFGALMARRAKPYSDWQNTLDAGRRLRVGLVSGDLRNHPVGYFIESVLAACASNACVRLEFIAYSNLFSPDPLTQRIKSSCHAWHSVSRLSDGDLARKIRDDGIDILLDLSGHTAHNRLPMFAWKPAPVQASWLGYFATTGLAEMDYLIADPRVAPVAEESHFTEKIMRLPETYLCFTPPDVDVQVGPLPALSAGQVTFGCFNNLSKINDAVVALWARVLQAVPGSCLFLKTKQLNLTGMQQTTVERFAAQGIDAGRLILEGHSPRDELLAAYRRVDIALDPFPFPGGTTSVEALWMGVPVLTLAGDRFLSHIGESILHNAGLPDWIAADAEEYVARAISHAGDLPRLSTLHDGLRQRVLTSPLFDAPRFARHFEDALRDMWTNWCTQQNGAPWKR